MDKYTYKARNSSGQVVTGTKEAEDKSALYKQLADEGLFVVEAKQALEKESSSFFTLKSDKTKKKIKVQEIIVFTRQLYVMLHAGLPLLDGIKIMMKQVDNPALVHILSEMADAIKAGTAFSEALKKYPKVFNQMYVSMVEAGEEGGVLEEILARLVSIIEKEEDTRSKIKAAFAYPVIVVFITIGVVGFLTTFVFPKFIVIFLQGNATLPLPTKMLFVFSSFVRGNWYFLVAAVFIFILGLKKYRSTSGGKFAIDAIILKLPMIGDLTRKVVLGRFASTLATLYASGVPILNALDIVEKSVTNSVINSWMREVREGVKGGKSLAKPMEQVGQFPPMMVQMIATGEETGAVSEMLTEIANSYDVEVDYAVKTVTSAIEPILIVFMGIVVGFTALSLFLPMLDMMKMVK